MIRHLQRPTRFILGSLVLVQLGCSTDSTVDLAGPSGAALKDYASAWDGHAEAYSFDTANGGTDRVRITVNGDGTGTLHVGNAPLYPPATNFDVGYPVGAKRSPDLFAGVAYPLHSARVEQDRLRFTIDNTDPFGEWCAHQTPYGAGSPPDSYYCIPIPLMHPTDDTCQTGQQTPVDCLKASECLSVCTCSATGCVAAAPTNGGPPGSGLPPLQFDGALEQNGKSLVGTLVMQDDTRVTLRLARP
jgi:hypothetical protein